MQESTVNLRFKEFIGPDKEISVEALGAGTREVKSSQRKPWKWFHENCATPLGTMPVATGPQPLTLLSLSPQH